MPYVANTDGVSSPHRTSGEMIIWAQEVAAEVLSFSPQNYAERLNSFKKLFVPEGWQLYSNYMRSTRFLNLVTERGYSAITIVNGEPDILEQSVSGNNYRWSIKVPVTISFYKGMQDGTAKTDITGRYVLYLEVIRVMGDGDGAGIAISGWKMEESSAR